MIWRACTRALWAPAGSGKPCRRRLKPFDVHLHYTDRHRLPAETEEQPG
jgi:hypothetical protein